MKQRKNPASIERSSDIDPCFLGFLAEGLWSGFGVAAAVQPQAVAVHNDKLFYLFRPQQWVTTCFVDEVLDDLCAEKL